MRFFIIPKRMFGNEEDAEKSKKKISRVWWIVVSVLIVFCAVVLLVVCRVTAVPEKLSFKGVGEVSLSASTEQERVEFFERLGYKVHQVQKQEITIPCTDGEFSEYNELQKSQGFDLTAYCGKTATLYTMKIEGGNQRADELFGVIIVYKDKVVAGHITDNLYPACVRALATT